MATKYAVVSGAWSSIATWSDTDGGAGGAALPADGDSVVISAAVNVLLDVDQSAWVGLLNVTIRGGVIPGSLYGANGTNGFLRIRTAGILSGTLATNKGRLIANSDGAWATTTGLQYSNKFVIQLDGTATITATNLDINFRCTEPTIKYVETFGNKVTVTVDPATDVFTAVNHGFTASTTVMIKSSGTVPSPLYPGIFYYVVSTTTNTFKLSYTTSTADIINIADTGSGTLEVYSGAASGATTVNVFQDVTNDPQWNSTPLCNVLGIVDYGGDVQKSTFVSATSSQIVLGIALDSIQTPGARIYLGTRNISILYSSTSTGQYAVTGSVGNSFRCSIQSIAASTTSGYLRGFGTSTDNYISIFFFMYGSIWACSYNTVDIILGGSYGLYSSWNTVNSILGANPYPIYGNKSVVNEFFGAGGGISGNSNIVNIINCCSEAINSGFMNEVAHVWNCAYGLTATSATKNNKITNTVLGTTNISTAAANGGTDVFKNIITDRVAIINVNNTTYRSSTAFENFNRVQGDDRIYHSFGNIFRVHCDGINNNPSVNPIGTNADCISVTPLSNCSIESSVEGIVSHRIWLTAGTHTVSYSIQSTFTSLLAADLMLTCEYVGEGGANFAVVNTNNYTTRTSASDWSQTASVTFTSALDGWVDLSITLGKYEAGKYVYIWPVPTVS